MSDYSKPAPDTDRLIICHKCVRYGQVTSLQVRTEKEQTQRIHKASYNDPKIKLKDYFQLSLPSPKN
jgi:hypothetical protein